jgi:hypothetical protein
MIRIATIGTVGQAEGGPARSSVTPTMASSTFEPMTYRERKMNIRDDRCYK